MALSSMTGYGRGTAATRGFHVVAEVSSVNRRQLDIRTSLPKPLAVLESRVFGEVQKRVSRGHVAVSFEFSMSGVAKRRSVHVDRDLARAYLDELRQTAHALGLPDDLSASLLTQLPDVIARDPGHQDLEALWPLMERALRRAMSQLLTMRRTEGKALAEDLKTRFRQLRRYLEQITRLAPGVAKKQRALLTGRLREAGIAVGKRDPVVAREIAVFADRCDISEELTRLKSHLVQGGKLLTATEPSGRALDFLVQEILREVNTIGSKANNAGISSAVIQFKAELERIREQVQNVE